jgi:hypothetical protein
MDEEKGAHNNDVHPDFHNASSPLCPSDKARQQSTMGLIGQRRNSSEGRTIVNHGTVTTKPEIAGNADPTPDHGLDENGFQRIVRNFTPS